MRILHQLFLAFACLVMCTGLCARQSVGIVSQPNASAAEEGKNTVQGKVVQDPGGQGIRKVKVTLAPAFAPSHGPYQTTTDEAGQFKIENVGPGTYRVLFERPGFASDTKAQRTITVGESQNTKELVLHMLMAGVISGKIVDNDGDPLRSATVTATEKATKIGGASPSNGTTNDLGEYRIADLLPGKYIVQAYPPRGAGPLPSPNEKGAAKERLVYVATYFPGVLDERQAAAVEVPAGGIATADFGVQTSRAYIVSGTITGFSGNRMTQIFLIGRNGQMEQQSLAESGKFVFSNVLPGTYKAQIVSFSGFTNGQMPSMKAQTIRTPIEVNDSDLLEIELHADPTGEVTGRLRMDGDEKVNLGGLVVTLRPLLNGDEDPYMAGMAPMLGMAATAAKVNEDGSFEIKDAPGIDCQLEIGAQSDKFRDYYTKSVLLGGREVADTGFTVNPGTRLDVLVSAKGAAIEGTVLDADRKPVPAAIVVTVPSSGKLGRPDAYQIGGTDDSGHFNLRGINPGEFLVLAFEEMPVNHHSPEFAKKYEAKGEKVELEEGAKKTVVLKLVKDEDRQQ